MFQHVVDQRRSMFSAAQQIIIEAFSVNGESLIPASTPSPAAEDRKSLAAPDSGARMGRAHHAARRLDPGVSLELSL